MDRLTFSVCPVCLKTIPAQQVEEQGNVYLEKTCEEHGFFKTLIWEGAPNFWLWGIKKRPTRKPGSDGVKKGCPHDCGLCGKHRQRTCCILLEVTKRCNLHCPVCFANAGNASSDASLEQIALWFDIISKEAPGANIQLSGGEPTVRDDIPEIITIGRSKGFNFFQLNTNGLRLAQYPEYAHKLKKAGLSCVFLQFDGFKESTQAALRGRSILNEKLIAIDNCKAAGLPVVLVPVLADGINLDEVGDIIKFAIDKMPAVKGVHFQPMSRFGRCCVEDEGHITLPKLLREIEHQTEGKIKASDFSGGTAENPLCSFSGNFVITPDGEISSINSGKSICCAYSEEADLGAVTAVEHSRNTVAKRWGSKVADDEVPPADIDTLDGMLYLLKHRRFSISAMLFQDCMNLDLERLQDCYVHVMSQEGKIIPFCAYNLTSLDGKTLYRK